MWASRDHIVLVRFVFEYQVTTETKFVVEVIICVLYLFYHTMVKVCVFATCLLFVVCIKIKKLFGGMVQNDYNTCIFDLLFLKLKMSSTTTLIYFFQT